MIFCGILWMKNHKDDNFIIGFVFWCLIMFRTGTLKGMDRLDGYYGSDAIILKIWLVFVGRVSTG